MGQLVTFTAAVRDESILEAVEKQTPAVLTVPVAGRWVTMKTRISRADRAAGVIALDNPAPEEGQPSPVLTPGQCVSLSFRRGHRKCMAMCMVAGIRDTQPDGAICLRWPEELLAVQRRAYFRAEVPEGMIVQARLWRGGRSKRRLVAVGQWPSVVGRLVDCSAGGMRMEVEADQDPGIQVGEPAAVEFSPLREVGQICLDANFRYRLEMPSGKVGLGLQFVGLESSAAGRQMLLVLGQVSAEYLRRGHRGVHGEETRACREPVSVQNGAHEPSRPACADVRDRRQPVWADGSGGAKP
jgi:c-di-GMP-binding flagellar brake protein YcgR